MVRGKDALNEYLEMLLTTKMRNRMMSLMQLENFRKYYFECSNIDLRHAIDREYFSVKITSFLIMNAYYDVD